MFDLSKEKIEVKCSCGRKHFATLKDATNRRAIRCSCGTVIQLQDGNGSVKKGVESMNRAFKDLEKALKRLGK